MNAKLSKSSKGFTATGITAAFVVLTLIGSVVLVLHHNQRAVHSTHSNTAQASSHKPTNSDQSASESTQHGEPTENGKYLYIKEWGVRVALPMAFQGKTTYSITNAADPDSGLPLQAATIYVAAQALSPNDCAVMTTDVGPSIQAGVLYIRSETSKPFNSARYKPVFKPNILVTDRFAYHLSYATPDCVGGDNDSTIASLHSALVALNLVK